MPASAANIARDERILAGYRAGRSLLDLTLAGHADPDIVPHVLRRERDVVRGRGWCGHLLPEGDAQFTLRATVAPGRWVELSAAV